MPTRLRIRIHLPMSSLCEYLRAVRRLFPHLSGYSAHPYGTPTVLSSYTGFTNTDLGAPNGGKASDMRRSNSTLSPELVTPARYWDMLRKHRDQRLVRLLVGSKSLHCWNFFTSQVVSTSLDADCWHGWVPQQCRLGRYNELCGAGLTADRLRQRCSWIRCHQQHRFVHGLFFSSYTGRSSRLSIVDSAWTTTFQTSLPAGNYCDVTTGTASNGACSGVS